MRLAVVFSAAAVLGGIRLVKFVPRAGREPGKAARSPRRRKGWLPGSSTSRAETRSYGTVP